MTKGGGWGGGGGGGYKLLYRYLELNIDKLCYMWPKSLMLFSESHVTCYNMLLVGMKAKLF